MTIISVEAKPVLAIDEYVKVNLVAEEITSFCDDLSNTRIKMKDGEVYLTKQVVTSELRKAFKGLGATFVNIGGQNV